jgi:hypothetical protein
MPRRARTVNGKIGGMSRTRAARAAAEAAISQLRNGALSTPL